MPKAAEQEVVTRALEEATGVHFEVIAPHPAFPLPVESLDWFMRCRNKDEIDRSPYLNAAWKDKGGPMWLESLAVGDTVDWIELAYGEDKVGDSLSIDYSRFDDKSFQDDFSQKFPIVLERVREYDQAAADVSKRRRVQVEIRRAGTKGIMVFTISARLDLQRGATKRVLANAVAKNAAALNETYSAIGQI